MSHPEPITDSPWLWFALFSAVGLTALLATGGKFGNRQAGLERKAQARAALAKGLDIEVGQAGRKTATGVPVYSTPQHTLIRLGPLAVILGIVCAASIALLVRERWHASESNRPS